MGVAPQRFAFPLVPNLREKKIEAAWEVRQIIPYRSRTIIPALRKIGIIRAEIMMLVSVRGHHDPPVAEDAFHRPIFVDAILVGLARTAELHVVSVGAGMGGYLLLSVNNHR